MTDFEKILKLARRRTMNKINIVQPIVIPTIQNEKYFGLIHVENATISFVTMP